MLDLPTLGKRIAERRSSLKLTQAALASAAHVGRATLDALENGRAGELGFAKVARILAALDLNLRIVESAHGRPTLEDLLAEDDDRAR
ncbi:MAG TPA: helix-turn-helix transcriptional regulator [Caulobacteraceae bacterium]|jgi:transcriptional regulator with XRE-family HTH domain